MVSVLPSVCYNTFTQNMNPKLVEDFGESFSPCPENATQFSGTAVNLPCIYTKLSHINFADLSQLEFAFDHFTLYFLVTLRWVVFIGVGIGHVHMSYVCVEVLRPSQPSGFMLSAVSLPNHTFTGQV